MDANALGRKHEVADPSVLTRALLPEAYGPMRSVAEHLLRSERLDHTLQPTALVHEVFLRLLKQEAAAWRDADHLVAVGVEVARRVLVDHARGRLAAKRGGARRRVQLDAAASRTDDRPWSELIALDEAIEQLTRIDARTGRVAALHLYGQQTHDQIARVLGVSRTTVATDWLCARAWLSRQLRGDPHVGSPR